MLWFNGCREKRMMSCSTAYFDGCRNACFEHNLNFSVFVPFHAHLLYRAADCDNTSLHTFLLERIRCIFIETLMLNSTDRAVSPRSFKNRKQRTNDIIIQSTETLSVDFSVNMFYVQKTLVH